LRGASYQRRRGCQPYRPGSTPDIPGYRSLTFLEPEKAQAALGRRIFDAESEPETVDYAQYTTAEFLGAEVLAGHIRDGLPFGRGRFGRGA
jgi:hypothetical protein